MFRNELCYLILLSHILQHRKEGSAIYLSKSLPKLSAALASLPTAFRLTLLTAALATSPLKILQWSPSSCRVTSEILSIFNCFVSCSTEVTQGHAYARQVLHQYAMGLALMFSGEVNPDSISPLTGKALRGAYDVAHTGRSRTTLRSLFSLPPLHGVQGRSKVSKLMQQVLLLAWPSCWPLTKI